MRFALLLGLFVAVLLLVAVPVPAEPTKPKVCVAPECPWGAVACVTGIHPHVDVCVTDPVENCIDVVWLHQEVGPYTITGSGCRVHVRENGRPLLP